MGFDEKEKEKKTIAGSGKGQRRGSTASISKKKEGLSVRVSPLVSTAGIS